MVSLILIVATIAVVFLARFLSAIHKELDRGRRVSTRGNAIVVEPAESEYL
jgi:hypothetical protein